MRSLMFVAIGLVSGVATGCQTYAAHQAAFVPHATPVPGDGQPLDSPAELGLGVSSVDVIQPTASDPNAGDAVPRVQMRGSLDFRVGRDITLGAVVEHGERPEPVTPYQPPISNGGPTGYGFHVNWSIPTGTPGLRIGLSTEVLAWDLPYVQYDTCVQNCGPGGNGYTVSYQGTDNATTYAFGVVPSYHTGSLTVFGGVTVRNQPTVPGKVLTDNPGDAGVQDGAPNLTLHAGIEADLGWMRVGVVVHDTVTSAPISYGPSVAAMIAIPLGKRGPRPMPVMPPIVLPMPPPAYAPAAPPPAEAPPPPPPPPSDPVPTASPPPAEEAPAPVSPDAPPA
jgi:hypothetical protein